MSTLCLFVVLGGVAWAAALPKNSVGAKQLKANAVRTGKVKNGTLKREDAKAGAFVVPSQLSGINAAKLGGIAPGGFVQGAGHLVTKNYDVSVDTDALVTVPGGGAIGVKCDNSGANPFFQANSGTFDVWQTSYVSGAAKPFVSHRTATPPDSGFVFIGIKPDTYFTFDVDSDGSGGTVTVWNHFDDPTDHCLGRIRGVLYP